MVRSIVKLAARHTLVRFRRPRAVSGPLAIAGGLPVRDIRLQPWPDQAPHTRWQWSTSVAPALRRVFLSGVEGLPQPRQVEFARRWADYCGCRHALLLPHGTDALRFALAAALDHDGLDYGGEVIVPNLSFIATATAALDRRLGVAFVDVDPETLNLDPARVEEAIVPGKTRAIMPVHQFGQPAAMNPIMELAAKYGLRVVEDAAQAHGARYRGRSVGALGHAAGFSFQSAKNLAAGEGGMLTTDDTEIYERAHAMHNAGRLPSMGARWEHVSLGWNCRPTEYQAALLMHRLDGFEAQQDCRRANFAILRERLAAIDCVRPLAVGEGVERHGMYMFVLRYQPEYCGGLPIDDFIAAARAEGVPLHRGYARTLSQQPVMQDLLARRPAYVRVCATPVADAAVQSLLYIAGSIFLTGAPDMHDIADAFLKVERHYRQAGAR